MSNKLTYVCVKCGRDCVSKRTQAINAQAWNVEEQNWKAHSKTVYAQTEHFYCGFCDEKAELKQVDPADVVPPDPDPVCFFIHRDQFDDWEKHLKAPGLKDEIYAAESRMKPSEFIAYLESKGLPFYIDIGS